MTGVCPVCLRRQLVLDWRPRGFALVTHPNGFRDALGIEAES